MTQMTPPEIVSELDKHIVGQDKAKKAVAIALRNRWRRAQVDEPLRSEITPKNILMIGPTGVGKTEIARRLARLANAPFIKIEATKFTEVGYVGRDVDTIIRDLMEIAIKDGRERARDRRAEQIRHVETREAVRIGREDSRQREPGAQERREQDQHDPSELDRLAQRRRPVPLARQQDHREEVERRVGDHDVARQNGERAGHAGDGEKPLERDPSQAVSHRHEHRSGAEPEQRDADHDVGEVVDELEREDAGVVDLEENDRQRDEKRLAIGRWPGSSFHGWGPVRWDLPAPGLPSKGLAEGRVGRAWVQGSPNEPDPLRSSACAASSSGGSAPR